MIESNKLKVLFVTPSVSRLFTGIYEVEINIAKYLHKKGVDFEIHSLIDAYTNKDLKNWLPLKPILYESFGPKSLGYNPFFVFKLFKSSADVGHIHSLWSYTTFAMYRWSKICKKPYLYTVNAYLFDTALKQSGFKKKIALFFGLKNVIKNASCIQVNTLNEYHTVRSLGFKNPICLISNGVRLPNLNLNLLSPWHSFKETQDKKILLYLSRIHPQKGINLLIEAWELLFNDSKLKEWHLIIVGFGENYSNYEYEISNSIILKNSCNAITILHGQYGELMDACYANCDAFILPSFNDGASIAALNALAFSKPSILTEGCNLSDSFSQNASIRIETNTLSIYKGIERLMAKTDLERLEMGANGRKLVEEKYSWEFISLKILEIYNWLKAGKIGKLPSTIILD